MILKKQTKKKRLYKIPSCLVWALTRDIRLLQKCWLLLKQNAWYLNFKPSTSAIDYGSFAMPSVKNGNLSWISSRCALTIARLPHYQVIRTIISMKTQTLQSFCCIAIIEQSIFFVSFCINIILHGRYVIISRSEDSPIFKQGLWSKSCI